MPIGPIIGPMVMAGVLADENQLSILKSIGVKDSKLLIHKKRLELYDKIISSVNSYRVVVVQPFEIDSALDSQDMNLNWLEAHTSARIINELSPASITVDCPSVNTSAYRDYLLNLLINKNVACRIEHKADLNYVECSAASILAKVVREMEVSALKEEFGDFGSGYLADPKTDKFLKEHAFDFPHIFRKTWAPYKVLANIKNQRSLADF